MKRGLLFAVAVLLCSMGVMGQALPIVVSYPSNDSGWTLTGNVASLGCSGSCAFPLPYPGGNAAPAAFDHTPGNYEPFNDVLMQLQANGTDSFASLLFNVPTTGTYKIAFDVIGAQGTPVGGGSSVWPQINFVLNAANINICRYPNNVSITATTQLVVDNGGNGSIHEYAESCAISLSAGNNVIAIQQAGGHGQGGTVQVRNVVIYAGTSTGGNGVVGNVGCQNSSGVWKSIQTSGVDLPTLAYNAWSWARNGTTSACYNNNAPLYINLVNGTPQSGGCGTGNTCRLLEVD